MTRKPTTTLVSTSRIDRTVGGKRPRATAADPSR
jgi:hypothetical protein